MQRPRCCSEEWPTYSGRSGYDDPLTILIFFAATENGSACSGRSGDEVRVRFHSLLPQRRMVLPAERHYLTAAVILDFRV